jgi:gas vesicle protein
MDWKQIISGIIIGAILGIGGTLLIQERRTSRLETQVEHLKSQIDQLRSGSQQPESGTVAPREPKAKPEELISIIQEQQRKNVRESWGELAHECFTDNDLDRFVQNKATERITESLKRDPQFLDIVLAIRKMQPGERSALLISADKPLRPTWREIGRISREGQTEAGQDAERMIATAIVNLVKKLVNMSEAEFLTLYND